MLDRDNPGHERCSTGVSPVDSHGQDAHATIALDFALLAIACGSRPKVRLY